MPTPTLARVLRDQTRGDQSFASNLRALARSLSTVRHLATSLNRAAQIAGRRVPRLGTMIKQLNHLLTGADIAWQATIGDGLTLHHPTGVVIGPGVEIGDDCRVQQGVTIGGKGGRGMDGSPFIGDRVHIGTGAKVLGPVSVGDGCEIGANAVVITSIPPGSVAVGVPARVVG